MELAFKSSAHEKMFHAALREIGALGYDGELLRRNYSFRDWFAQEDVSRVAPAVAFGRTPISYDNACVAVLLPNGHRGPELVREFRALGAPLAFEVFENHLVEWRVAREPTETDRRSTIHAEELSRVFADNANAWSPLGILRAKNIGPSFPMQLDVYDLGLITALEENLRTKLDPIFRNVLARAQTDFLARKSTAPNPRELFRIAIWQLAGKIFHDRGIAPFSGFTRTSDPDDVLGAVATYYNESLNNLLLKSTRKIIHEEIWTKLDLANVSVEVLAQVWLNTFVTKDVRDKLGIHQTPRSVARYIVERLPLDTALDTLRPIVEPCCGSATFLIAALNRLHDLAPPEWSPKKRHTITKKLLKGFEADPLALEISRLSLTLADFPNPNGWHLESADVFDSRAFDETIAQASFVVCNPPYGDFDEQERAKYNVKLAHKPAELMRRILDRLPRDANLGFVLPRRFHDGIVYRQIRAALVDRWKSIEIVDLPEGAFETADQETLLVIATAPKTSAKSVTKLAHCQIKKQDWRAFESRQHSTAVTPIGITRSEAQTFLGARNELSALWEYLAGFDQLQKFAAVHRGIEWNKKLTEDGGETGNRRDLISDSAKTGYMAGFPPRSDVRQFQSPPTKFLSVKKEDRRRFNEALRWDLPKIFLNKSRKSRESQKSEGHWPLAAFAELRHIISYQTLTAIWPNDSQQLLIIEAVLNGPIANAFVAVREGKFDVRVSTVRSIPMPRFELLDVARLEVLVNKYRELVAASDHADEKDAGMTLRAIDALILEGYALPHDLEIELLRWFNGNPRAVPFEFGNYFPPHADVGISLQEFVDIETRWQEVNKRRIALIEREIDETITPEEALELERLQMLADIKFRPFHQEAMRRLDIQIASEGR